MITLTLGDFVFQDMEIPEAIPFGGPQSLSKKKLIGGVRVIDALGPDPKPLEWSGTFWATPGGQTALDRALTLKQMADAGQPLDLSWDSLYYRVLIASFEPDYRFARIPYRISCEIIQDLTAPVYQSNTPDADDLISADLYLASLLAEAIADQLLLSLISELMIAANLIVSFVNAPLSTINLVLQPLIAASGRVGALITLADTTLLNTTAPGGVLPGAPVSASAAALAVQVAANQQQVDLIQLQALCGRIARNLSQINSSVRTITVPGGNLYDIASLEYGDATAWTLIAQANGLTDPQLSGITELTIPPYNGASGGVSIS